MSDSQTFIVTFTSTEAYEKYKQEVIASPGGEIKNDFGNLLGFTAKLPSSLIQQLFFSSGDLADDEISSFELDSVVTTQ